MLSERPTKDKKKANTCLTLGCLLISNLHQLLFIVLRAIKNGSYNRKEC